MQFSLLRMAMLNRSKFYVEINFGSVRGILTSAHRFDNNERSFSKSMAYYGRDRILDPSLAIPAYLPSYYDSKRFKLIKKASFLLSWLALLGYCFFFREERDYDELMNIDPQLAIVFQKKQELKKRKENMVSIGKDTRGIDMEMLEILAKEAEIKAKLKEKQVKKDSPTNLPQNKNISLMTKMTEEKEKNNKERKDGRI